MSKTPIYDFVSGYANSHISRLHMPGHKGKGKLGCEQYDITEISGADSLFEADGIIAESEKKLSDIFSTRASFYSTEGSSLCIRAMVYMAKSCSHGKKKILAGRNAHKSFMYAVSLCDVDVDWIYGESLYSCNINTANLDSLLCTGEYYALYITSPDYLGNVCDIAKISKVCKKYDVVLLVDNAHGAYLNFLGEHPMQNGADMCCDSAHKTLPCLTGSAYLHVSKTSKYPLEKTAKRALSLFASTSPSYLVMASMDLANMEMSDGFEKKALEVAEKVANLREKIQKVGLETKSDEPFKITIAPKSYGFLGTELAKEMSQQKIECEFCDRDNLVLMFSTNTQEEDFQRLSDFFENIKRREKIDEQAPKIAKLERKISIRQALFSQSECVDVINAKGRILASPCVSCPPAIPIAVCGEVIDETAVEAFLYYGILQVDVIK